MTIDPAQAVCLELEPGEFSLHHIGIAHGSAPNNSDTPRIGLAVRYIAPQVAQAGAQRDLAVLARGSDRYGHFDLVDAPTREWGLDEDSPQRRSLQRKLENDATQRNRPAGQVFKSIRDVIPNPGASCNPTRSTGEP